MDNIKISMCFLVIFLITVNFVKKSASSDIECISINKCPFAYQVTNRTGTENAKFFIENICGYDKEGNAKIWCNKIVECSTPDNKQGVCLPIKLCLEFVDRLEKRNNLDLATKNNLRSYQCKKNNAEEIHVCCSYPISQEVQKNINFQESKKTQAIYANTYNYLIFDTLKKTKRKKRHIFDPSWSERESSQEDKYHDTFKGFRSYPHHGRFHHLQQKKHFPSDANHVYDNDDNLDSSNANKWFDGRRNNKNFFNWFKPKNHEDEGFVEDKGFFNKPLDNACNTPAGEKGFCIPVNICKEILRSTNNNAYDKYFNDNNQDIETFKCKSPHKTPLHICCSKRENNNKDIFKNNDFFTTKRPIKLATKTRTPTIQETTTARNTITEKDIFKTIENICGTQELTDDRILGGSSTDLGEFPWLALLQYSGRRGLVYGCAGSLITNRFVLTAAHCIDLKILRQKSLNGLYKVVLGEYNIQNKTDCFYSPFGSICADPVKYYNIDKSIAHDSYQSAKGQANDIGLIKLDREVLFSGFIRPICLPDLSYSLTTNENVVISGWGRTETDQMSFVKRKASLRLTLNSHCNEYLDNVSLGNGQICMNSGNGTDSCNGDSGGAVMIETRSQSGRSFFTLVGVISFGFRPCGRLPSVATNVSQYLNWIKENVNRNL